jgi:hypothetical protein
MMYLYRDCLIAEVEDLILIEKGESMRIENIRREQSGDRARVTATVHWEECGRPAQDIYFETSEENL